MPFLCATAPPAAAATTVALESLSRPGSTAAVNQADPAQPLTSNEGSRAGTSITLPHAALVNIKQELVSASHASSGTINGPPVPIVEASKLVKTGLGSLDRGLGRDLSAHKESEAAKHGPEGGRRGRDETDQRKERDADKDRVHGEKSGRADTHVKSRDSGGRASKRSR